MSTDTTTRHAHGPDEEVEPFDANDPRLTRFDLVREGARRDGVEIVHYEPRFPVPGTLREKRIVRTVGLMFLLSGLFGLIFVVAYIWFPWKYQYSGSNDSKLYTPILGISLGLALALLGTALITWGKKLLPEEIAVQERHPGGSEPTEKKLTGATMLNMVDELGIKRRPMLGAIALLGMAPLGIIAAEPLIGGLIKDPETAGPDGENILMTTGWTPTKENPGPIPVTREDGTRIRPEDVSVGGQMTVYPGIPGGASNQYADSPTLLIRLRDPDADALRANLGQVPGNKGFPWNNYVAYSKICTHAGCPASLYEQQTNRLLCPCHQSQFNILDNARPIFGPATRRLPMLPLAVDADGYFVAGIQQQDGTIKPSGYTVPVGPGFWERSDREK
jgi:ubiquinol-cytochrome c reductase iron-sulfur subunit